MIPAMQEEKQAPEWLARAIRLLDEDKRGDGDTLSHDWLKFALSIPEAKSLAEVDDVQWILLTRLDAFRDWLLVERKVALQNVRGQGYRIVPPSEQAQYAAEEAMKLVRKGLQKGDKMMTHCRVQELNNEEKKRHTDAHLRIIGVGEMMKREKRDIFKLLR